MSGWVGGWVSRSVAASDNSCSLVQVVAVEDELELELYPLDICVGKISPKTGRPLSFGNQLRGLFRFAACSLLRDVWAART